MTELKSFGSPPPAVLMVTGAVMVLMEGQKGKIPKDRSANSNQICSVHILTFRSWPKVKMMMNKVDQFLDSLIHYDKENIHPNILSSLEMYLKDKEFDPEFIRSKSGAAAGLCSWVINVCKFYEVYCEVEPKRRALNDANRQLQEAKAKLEGLIAKVIQLEETLADLTRRYTVAVEAKVGMKRRSVDDGGCF